MISKKPSVAIIGSGPAGCMCAYFASANNDVTLFDSSSPLSTLLYTGGGRCNLAYAEYDFKELVKFYPRGEKFLFSIFSRFCTGDTIDFFNQIGVDTYTQDDLRIFPTSNSAKDVREKFLNNLTNQKKCKFKKEKVQKVEQANDFVLKTEGNKYNFDKVVIATGGHAGFKIAQELGHTIVPPKPALTGLITAENFKELQGLSLKNVNAQIYCQGKKFAQVQDDLLFTHEGISGPLAYKISSICARLDYSKGDPLLLKLETLKDELDLQYMLNSNPKKDIKNLIAELVPKSLAEYILKANNIEFDKKCCEINGKIRDSILTYLKEFEINVVSPAKNGEVVTSGGISLNEIDSKTMESKLINGIYFCGEVIDIDGFCGGFNLQNCWSTGFTAGKSI